MFVIPEDVKKRLMSRFPDRCVVWVLHANGRVDYNYVTTVQSQSLIADCLAYARRNNGSWVKAWAVMRLSDGIVLARSR